MPTIAKSFGNLTKLEYLYVFYNMNNNNYCINYNENNNYDLLQYNSELEENDITTLPSNIGNLKKLKQL